jgi:hypothetical protein
VTLFEYVAVAVSLVCSFAAVRLLGGLAAVLDPDRRYWVHATWVFGGLYGLSLSWWTFWSNREVEWDYARFLMALSPRAILYVIAGLLIPADTQSVRSWQHHYFNIRIRFFALSLAYVAAIILNSVVLLGAPILHPRHLPLGVLGVMYVVGLVSEHPKLHAAIVMAFVGINLIGTALIMRPGSLAVVP